MNKDLTVGKPEWVLLQFSLPLLGSIIFQQLYNIADSLVAGKFIGDNALAAVGNSYEITLIFLAFAFGCNIGCSVIVARLFGAKQYVRLKTAVYTTLIATGVLCVLLMILGFIFSGWLLRAILTPDEIFADSLLYLIIYIWGLPFLFFYNISTGIFSALGDSRTPFVFLAASSVVNILADILFVTAFDMGVAGVAWATFICQGVSCVLAVVFVFRKLRNVGGGRAPLFSWKLLGEIAVVAVPSTLQQGFISVGNILIQGVINSYGTVVTAGYAAAIKLNNLVITSFTALGNGMSNFTAQNLGAGRIDRVQKGYRCGLVLIYALAVPAALLYVFFGGTFLRLFSDAQTGGANAVGLRFLRIVAPFYLIAAAKLISDGVLRGAGSMLIFMISTFTDLILRVLFAYILSPAYGSDGIWYAWPVGWVCGTLISVVACLGGVWKRKWRAADGFRVG